MLYRILFPSAVVLALSGCMALVGKGEPVAVKDGKTVYQSRCTVDQSTAGKQGLLGTGIIPVHGLCSLSAEKRCGKGNYTIESVDQSNFRRERVVTQTGTMRSMRTFPAVDEVVRFTCKG